MTKEISSLSFLTHEQRAAKLAESLDRARRLLAKSINGAVEAGDMSALDHLELEVLRLSELRPGDLADMEEHRPYRLHRFDAPLGTVIEWQPLHCADRRDDHGCDACDGRGEFYWDGRNGRSYRLDCPECDGTGTLDTETVLADKAGQLSSDWVYTDMDCNILLESADRLCEEVLQVQLIAKRTAAC